MSLLDPEKPEFNPSIIDWIHYKSKYFVQISTEKCDQYPLPPLWRPSLVPSSVSDAKAYSHFRAFGFPQKRYIKLYRDAHYREVYGLSLESVAWEDYAERYKLKLKDFELLQHYYHNRNGNFFVKFKFEGLLYYDVFAENGPKLSIETSLSDKVADLIHLEILDSNNDTITKLVKLGEMIGDVSSVLDLL